MNEPGPPLSPAARRRVRRWRFGLGAALLAVAAGLGALAVIGVLSQRGQIRGQITVTSCVIATHRLHTVSYACVGTFAADIGDAPDRGVSFHNDGPLRAGDHVAATVSGPGDSTASLVSNSWWRLVVTGGGALMFVVAAALWGLTCRRRPV
jgi:hypothetical protein